MACEAAMFVQELSPIFQEFVQKPVVFLGGFASGLLRLNLSEDPVRTWLDRELGVTVPPSKPPSGGNGSGPQSINID
jgi:hypothetical protein